MKRHAISCSSSWRTAPTGGGLLGSSPYTACLKYYRWLMQAVTRVPFFKKYPLQHRAGIIIVPGIIAHFAMGFLYNRFIASETKKLVSQGNTPFWKDEHRVPELNKVFFELDDRKNFEPTILHHGLYAHL